ncbi:MAG: NAD(P)H-dependent oxidoreductase [Pleurocapsa sp. MO_226.B13]|nr:NAD(P)H-dependent oxidoreductase [Pleurocapsa sp. MO_226.B13]
MLNRKIVLLDGRGTGDEDLSPILDILLNELHTSSAAVQTFSLRTIKMGSCFGCFGCWVQTPGICLEPDMGRNIARAVIQSELTILFTPVTFGGYSSEIKKCQDRWLPLVLPDFGIYHDEVHHRPRSKKYPRLVGIGIQRQPNDVEANLFKVLVGRNALNFHSPTYAADVVLSSDDPDKLRQQLHTILVRTDTFPESNQVASLMQIAEIAHVNVPPKEVPGRALLIVGSPKVTSPSTSAALGGYVLNQLKQRGWDGESFVLRKNLLQGNGQTKFFQAFEQADLILLAFPLYIDSLPFLMMKFLETSAQYVSAHPQENTKRLLAIANNGFPEAHHNALALAICQRFAIDTGMIWLGGLAMGAGEALFSGLPITGTARSGRPPVKHIIQALDLASAALAVGQIVPPEAAKLMAKTPIPFMPFKLWRWLYIKMGNHHWRPLAAVNQVEAEDLLAQPYAELENVINL